MGDATGWVDGERDIRLGRAWLYGRGGQEGLGTWHFSDSNPMIPLYAKGAWLNSRDHEGGVVWPIGMMQGTWRDGYMYMLGFLRGVVVHRTLVVHRTVDKLFAHAT